VPFHKVMERPHGTRIILDGASAVKEISDIFMHDLDTALRPSR